MIQTTTPGNQYAARACANGSFPASAKPAPASKGAIAPPKLCDKFQMVP